ncbi:MAG: hypothetical protein K6E91_00615 [Butyrivibrio sp.]|nr:hypothetical protein [Butyrivibrio sp.]
MEAGFKQLDEQKQQKQPDFEQLKEQQKQRLQQTITEDVINRDIALGKQEEKGYSDDFISEQVRDQRAFYADYSNRWNKDYEGQKVNISAYRDPVDQQISEDNLKFFNKYSRKVVKAREDEWNELMENVTKLTVVDTSKKMKRDKEGKPVYETKEVYKQEAYNGFKLLKKPNAYTFEIMKSTVRIQTLESTRNRIINQIYDELTKEEGYQKKYGYAFKHIDEIIALAPQIKTKIAEVAPGKDDEENILHKDDYHNFGIDQNSVEEFKAFIQKAFKNPEETLANAVTDALNSFNEVSMNMLDRHALPQKMDEAKLMRDKYQAVTTLFSKSLENKDPDDPILKKMRELRKDSDLAKEDNIHVAEILYRSIDADMRYSFLNNGVDFVDDGSFLDETAHHASYYSANVKKAKGELTKQLFNQIKSQVTSQGRRTNERYWEKECKKLISKDNEEKKAEYKDDYYIGKGIQNIKETLQNSVEGDVSKALFNQLCENGNMLARAIFDIDKELADSEDVLERRQEELKVRPGMKNRLKAHIEKRKQEQLDLLDRANGIINALKYLAGAEDLEENGKLVLDDARFTIESTKVDVTGNGEFDKVRELDFDAIELREMDHRLFGAHKNLNDFAKNPRTFEMFKKDLSEKFKDVNKEDLDKFLNKPGLAEYLDLLTIKNVDVMSLEFQKLKERVDEVEGDQNLRGKIMTAAEIALRRDIDLLFKKVYFSADFQKDKDNIIRQFKNLEQRTYSINRMSKLKLGSQTYKDFYPQNETLRKLYNQKFTIIKHRLNMYRYDKLTEYAGRSGLAEDMMTEAEWKEVQNTRKKAVQEKNGKYKDGKSPDILVLELMQRKKAAASNSWMARTKEYTELVRNDYASKSLYVKIKEKLNEILVKEEKEEKDRIFYGGSLTDNEYQDDNALLLDEEQKNEEPVNEEVDLEIEDYLKDFITKLEARKSKTATEKKEIELKEIKEEKKEDKKEEKKEELKEEKKEDKKVNDDDDDEDGFKQFEKDLDERLKEQQEIVDKIFQKQKEKDKKKQEDEERKKQEEEEEEDEKVTLEDVFNDYINEKGIKEDGTPITTKSKQKQSEKKQDQKDQDQEQKQKEQADANKDWFDVETQKFQSASPEERERIKRRLFIKSYEEKQKREKDEEKNKEEKDLTIKDVFDEYLEEENLNENTMPKTKEQLEREEQLKQKDLERRQAEKELYEKYLKEEEEEKLKNQDDLKKQEEEELKRQKEQQELKKKELEEQKKKELEEQKKKEQEEIKKNEVLKKQKELEAQRKKEQEELEKQKKKEQEKLENQRKKEQEELKKQKKPKKQEEERKKKEKSEEELDKELNELENEVLKDKKYLNDNEGIDNLINQTKMRDKYVKKMDNEENVQSQFKQNVSKSRNNIETDRIILAYQLEEMKSSERFNPNNVDRYVEVYDQIPEFKNVDAYVNISGELIKDILLAEKIPDILKITKSIRGKFKDVQGIDPAMKSVMTITGSMFDVNTINTEVVKKLYGNAQVDLKQVSLKINEDNEDFLWVINELSKCQGVADIQNLRSLWTDRERYFKSQNVQIDPEVYHKVDALLNVFGRACIRYEEQASNQQMVEMLDAYKPKEVKKDFDLKEKDTKNIYYFQQKQKESLSCWAASHTYVVNTYMKVHGIKKVKSFDEGTFKSLDNYTPHELVKDKLKDKSDKNIDSMSFNQEANNIKEYLTQNKVGNPYTVADSVITRVPKTAEHQMIFTFHKLEKMSFEQREAAKEKLTSYIIDKVESELERTKAPISCLMPGHYLSIVGVDRKTKQFKTMDSNNDLDKLNEYKMLKISDLINPRDGFSLTFPEYLDDKNMAYLSDKFGFGKGLYDKNGDIVESEELLKSKKKILEEPQYMMHVHGYEFNAQKHDTDFESDFLEDQIYMPKSLNLPAKLAKERGRKK